MLIPLTALLCLLALAAAPRAAPPAAPTAAPLAVRAAGLAAAPVAVPAAEPVWPLAGGSVVREFAPPAVRWAPGHRGVDVLGRPGLPVRSVAGGRVVFAGVLAGRGVVSVALDGPPAGHRVTYEPLAPAVAEGDRVRPGDVLGTLAAEGSHCAPRACLHWGLRVGPAYEDPLSLLASGPSVLLPVTGVPVPTRPGPGDRPGR
ncbi:M23 family metallopeptidase [Streptomyces sp. TRM70308]|uniref:murein hydrolase activator EnvC family protein n=1 Tax=Streptomyces sp. TRM70308 TaxID=3131932 RepID=UPI003CFC3E04